MPRPLTAAFAALVLGATFPVHAQTPAPGEAYKTSPFHKATSAATGKPIPCLCVFGGRNYRVGEAVCMRTHMGVVITKCDLHLNNTTWVPTEEPCTVSWADSGTSAGE
jgi:hypothetical protein